MIIEYDEIYSEEVVNLFNAFQMYIEGIDKEEFNIFTPFFGEHYLNKVLLNVNENNGKIYLYEEDDKIVGLIVGIINNNEEESFGYRLPKRGRITELIVLDDYRDKGIGTKLIDRMEEYLTNIGCKDILISTLAYNDTVKLYEKMGYHVRMVDMIKDVRLD